MKLGFIGIGNIATAVIKGLCTSTNFDMQINISPRNRENSVLLEGLFENVSRMETNQSVLDSSELIFIALPTGTVKDTLSQLIFSKHHRVISFVPSLMYNELLGIVAPATIVCRAVPFPTVERHECPILLFNPCEIVSRIFSKTGTPITVKEETELQILWTLTGMIAPFYDLCETLSNWAQSKGVEGQMANKFVMKLFSSLTCYVRQNIPFNLSELKKEATTPNGMNYQAQNIITQKQANEAYKIAADAVFEKFGQK